MQEPSNWKELDATVEPLWALAHPVILALHGVERDAAGIAERASTATGLLKRATTALAGTPRWDFTAMNELTDIYMKVSILCDEMRGLQAACLNTAQNNDHLMTPQRDAASAMLERCRAIADSAAAAAEQPEAPDPDHEAALQKWHGRGFLLTVERYGFGSGAGEFSLQRKKLKELAGACAGTLGLLAAWLAELDRLAQLQRGTWVLVGAELASAAATLGDRNTWQGIEAWSLSRSRPLLTLAAIRQVAAGATEYLTTLHQPK
ncbi:hypothetical protein [Siccirubricoccus sp. G192]|uniref:hypothetical protein n=1 Tax=Siccirubricoccus sp. G192 TaxID=2849651 RepID=UPI001C2BB852|nr:hypothetical protein [Siccirubricoccus sp. G192]MBV1800070.1 hypothetical protein [Siccirubricoccus sp. G192]